MTIAIGRAGRDTGLTLNSPTYWSMNGDEVDAGGALTASTFARLLVLRAQVNGLADNRDEPIVAVNWAGDPSVDGYYEVLSAQVPMPARGLAALKLDWRVRLRRLAVHPDISSVLGGNLVRANAHSIAKGTTVPWWATPADATMDHVTGATSATRAAETGNVKVQYTTDGTLLYDTVRRWAAPASSYYAGACRVEVTDGIAWYAIVGRDLPNVQMTGWRLNNGLVRVSYGGGDGLLTVEHYVSGAWSVSKTYKLTYTTSKTTLGAFSTVAVKDNRPECAQVRLGLERDSTAPYQLTVVITLRRGSLWAELVVTRDSATGTESIGIYRNTAEAGAAHTSGVHADAADAQGGKYVLTTSKAKTDDLTQGGFYVSAGASTAVDFMVGYEPASAAGPDTYTNQVLGYFAPVDEMVGFARR